MTQTVAPSRTSEPDRNGMLPCSSRLTERLGHDPSASDLIRYFAVPADRVLIDPQPGTVDFDDYVRWCDSRAGGRGVELIEKTLVRMARMSHFESGLATILIYCLTTFCRQRRPNGEGPIARVFDASDKQRMSEGNVREPDVSVFLAARLAKEYPDGVIQRYPKVSSSAANLAVEVLSESNTPGEIDRKRRELFDSGTELMWVVDPKRMLIEVWSSPDDLHVLHRDDTLEGGDVLPGFAVSVDQLFTEAAEI